MSTDTTNVVANAPGAPEGERYDAQAEMQKVYMPLASALMPPDAVREMMDFINADFEQQQLQKAQVIQFPGANVGARGRGRGMKSVQIDEMQVSIMGDYIEKPGALQFTAMRKMVEQTPVLNAVIMTRVRQVQRFANPLEVDDGPGFVLRSADLSHQPTESEKREMRLLQRFFVNCGWEFDPRRRRRLKRDNWVQFLAKVVRDSLTMDSAPIETEYKLDRNRGLDGFYAVDGSTIRLCTEHGYKGDDEVFALQVVQGRILTAYSYDDLIYEARNPRTDVEMAGYGLSETELLVRTVTGFLNAMTLNIDGFSKNSIPRGLLHLVGDYDSKDIAAFKRIWNAQVRGVNNAWALPIMASATPEAKASYTPIGNEFDEMYFSKWMTFLVSIICAIYGCSPDEINFESFSANKSSLSGSDTTEKLASSKDKGLRPLMAYLEALASDFICSTFGDKYVFRWAGLDDKDADKRHELKKLVATVDEIRAELNMGAAKEFGDAPVNPSMFGAWQQARQAEQQQEDESNLDFGDPNAGGAAGDPVPAPSNHGSGAAIDGKSDAGESAAPRGEGLSKAVVAPYRIGWES